MTKQLPVTPKKKQILFLVTEKQHKRLVDYGVSIEADSMAQVVRKIVTEFLDKLDGLR